MLLTRGALGCTPNLVFVLVAPPCSGHPGLGAEGDTVVGHD